MWKKILMSVGGLLLVLLLVPLLLSPKMHVQRSIEIGRSAATVHTYLADLNQYPKWNPFSENDPGSKSTVTGSGAGATLT